VGEPWVWDGEQWLSQDGYWTTVDNPQPPPDTRVLAAPEAQPEWPAAEASPGD
jgi:hypothetical protein